MLLFCYFDCDFSIKILDPSVPATALTKCIATKIKIASTFPLSG